MDRILSKEDLFSLRTKKPDARIYSQIKKKWDSISKPIDALGDFEDIICRIGAIKGTDRPQLDKRTLLVFCADNGIVSEGVSQAGPEVTLQVARLLGRGESSANTIAAKVGADCVIMDVGIDCCGEIPGVLDRKQHRGSRNFLEEHAMTEAEVLGAVGCGIEAVRELAAEGTDIILTGEMGIANTTTATALLCLLCGKNAEEMVGRGAGLDDAGLLRKLEVIRKALALYGGERFIDDRERAFVRLSEVGGYDIAAMCGVFIGGAVYSVPVVIDGLISAAAAITAEMILPGCREYMVASHSGREHGVREALEYLGLAAFINGNMALGEGTGALMLLPLLDTVFDYYYNAATFEQGGIKEYERYS